MAISTPFDAASTCTACGRAIVFDLPEMAFLDDSGTNLCGIAYDGLHTRALPVVTVPEQPHPNFHLWEVIDGLLQLHDTPAHDRECAWCDKPAVILLPASRNDNAWPQLTQRA